MCCTLPVVASVDQDALKKRDMLSCDFSDLLYLEGNNTHLPCCGNCYDSVCLCVDLQLNVDRHYHSHIVPSCSESLREMWDILHIVQWWENSWTREVFYVFLRS